MGTEYLVTKVTILASQILSGDAIKSYPEWQNFQFMTTTTLNTLKHVMCIFVAVQAETRASVYAGMPPTACP